MHLLLALMQGYLRLRLEESQKALEALECEPRRSILALLADGPLASGDIYRGLLSMGTQTKEKSTFYYHLSKLREAGLIRVRNTLEGAGKPERVWELACNGVCFEFSTSG